MAPEVHEQKSIYNRKADIYSLAMVLWEMWYGIAVNDELDSRIRGRLSVHIRNGIRPLFKTEGFTKPPDTWIELIQQCWHENPNFRPKASKIFDFFTSELATKNV
jgi:serine/threonine protein kinase